MSNLAPRGGPPAAAGVPGGFALSDRDFNEIADILRDDTGIHLNETKTTLVYSRLVKRLRKSGLDSFSDYCRLLRESETERQAMIEALTTNTTSFFRERHHFEHLKQVVLPRLIEAARGGHRVRLWSSAASSGQEAYSIAMTLLEVASDCHRLDVRILATDVNSQMVERGRDGSYDQDELEGIPRAMLSRHFHSTAGRDGKRMTVADEVKSLVVFRQLNLIGDWPMSGEFDVIFCRNVMIYFASETQSALWQRFATKMPKGAHLYIGHSERLTGPAARHFDLVAVTTYCKTGGRP